MKAARRAAVLTLWTLVAGAAAGEPASAAPPVRFVPTGGGPVVGPPPPPPGASLVVDDGTAEGQVGVDDPASQFLWFNEFDVTGPLRLDEIHVLFPAGEATPGDAIELVVYTDADGDPSNGATLVATFDRTVEVADGVTFSTYPLAPGLLIDGAAQVLIGVVPRWIVSGVTPATEPAALDTGSSQMRSWIAVWTGDPPSPPQLPPDDFIGLIDGFEPGNWLIRGVTSDVPILVIPTLGSVALAALTALLAIAGAGLLGRRRGTAGCGSQ